MIGRRPMLAGMAAMTGLGLSGAAIGKARRRLKRFGIQLYSLRVAAAADPPGVLRRLAALGYREVELGGPPYSTMEPGALRGHLDRFGLAAASMHVSVDELEADPDRIFDQARAIGSRYVVVPYLAEGRRSTILQCQRTAAQLTAFGRAARAHELTFAYHNHSFEFERVEGRFPFDILVGESDPDVVKVELDLYWAAKADVDIPDVFARYAGRIHLCHVKDMKADRSMTDVGAGTIDFAKLFALSERAGLRHYFVEHDAPPAPYWPSVAASADHLRRLRF